MLIKITVKKHLKISGISQGSILGPIIDIHRKLVLFGNDTTFHFDKGLQILKTKRSMIGNKYLFYLMITN